MYATLGVGLVPLGIFLLVKSGLLKSWFILKRLPGLLSARMIYASFPFGLSFTLLTFVPMLPGYDPDVFPYSIILLGVLFIGPLLGFWFMYKASEWSRPKWLRCLEE